MIWRLLIKLELFHIVVVYKKLSKISGQYHRDISEPEYQNCLNDCVVFKGSDCINEMSDHVLSFKGEPKKVKKKLLRLIYI